MARWAVAQVNPTIGAFESNFSKIAGAIQAAKAGAASVILFPEMAVSGYPPNDLLERQEFWEANAATLEKIQALSQDLTIVIGSIFPLPKPELPKDGGIPLGHGAVLFRNGAAFARQGKRNLPNVDVFNESRYFSPAALSRPICLDGSVKMALTVCEDMWNVEHHDRPYSPYRLYPGDCVAELIRGNPHLLVNLSASPYWQGKFAERLDRARSIVTAYRLPFVYVNAVGANDELIFDGRSFALTAEGDCVWQMSAFKEELGFFDLERLAKKSRIMSAMPASTPVLGEEEELLLAISLGIRDYAEKSGFQKLVLGLSGGIDSALTAFVASRALGKEAVLALWMPSPYSSRESEEDAFHSARQLGIECRTIPITPLMGSIDTVLTPWKEDTRAWKLTDENVQARLRGLLLMSIANAEGRLLLSTGNKSELATGYCTLYGDMCGALAPIGDLYKTDIYRLVRYLHEKEGLFTPRLLEKAPSAELRPEQHDQQVLPPYPVLDRLIAAYMEERKGPAELLTLGFDPAMVDWFVRTFHYYEYKRKQAAPILKLCHRSFGLGWRYPLVKKLK